jgi:hypothetical protein
MGDVSMRYRLLHQNSSLKVHRFLAKIDKKKRQRYRFFKPELSLEVHRFLAVRMKKKN